MIEPDEDHLEYCANSIFPLSNKPVERTDFSNNTIELTDEVFDELLARIDALPEIIH